MKPAQCDIDWDFIRTLEGFKTVGYIPRETNERVNNVKSGVTIGSGFDIGQHTIEYLKKIGLRQELVDTLAIYTVVTGRRARDILRANPLTLTPEEVKEVDTAVKNDKANYIASIYNRDSKLNFFTLPRVIQTVIMSVGFQYGDPSRRTPNFWRVVTSGDWQRAVWHLRNFGDSYKTRRNKEADYLQNYLKSKG